MCAVIIVAYLTLISGICVQGDTFILGHISRSNPERAARGGSNTMENTASAINMALEKFLATGSLSEHNFT